MCDVPVGELSARTTPSRPAHAAQLHAQVVLVVNERTLLQSRATEEGLKATTKTVTDSMAQTLKSFSATAVDTGGRVAGDLGEVFGSKARREIDPLVRSLQQAITQAQQVTEQHRSGLRWIPWGRYLTAAFAVALSASVWWNLEQGCINTDLMAQFTECL
jgi:hypothetical protein